MPQYAAGGDIDKVNSTRNQRNNRNSSVMKFVIIAVVLMLIFGANFSSKPLKLLTHDATIDAQTSEMQLDFVIKNTTIGLVFNPQYKIRIKDEAGNTTNSTTGTACRILAPQQSIKVTTVLPVSTDTDKNYEIELQCSTLRPY